MKNSFSGLIQHSWFNLPFFSHLMLLLSLVFLILGVKSSLWGKWALSHCGSGFSSEILWIGFVVTSGDSDEIVGSAGGWQVDLAWDPS
jgi:hypothetical protein